jgi:PAS domain S-box-containing protein
MRIGGPKVLIVDDDPDICVTLCDFLSGEGYDLQVVATGQAAIEAITGRRFDAVILDLGLPDQDGLVVLDRMHAFDQRLPIVVLTAFTVPEKTIESLKRGSVGYLTKPYQHDELRAVLAHAVKVSALATKADQAQTALLESEDRYKAVVESAGEAILCTDSNGRIISWNRGAARLFGYEHDEIIGQPLIRLMPLRFRDAHLWLLEAFEGKGETGLLQRTLEVVGLHKDGTEYPIELSIGTWQTKAGRCYSAIVRDLRERKRWETQILQQQIEQQVLLDLIPAMVWYKDCHNGIVRVNRRAAESIGRTVKEVEGASTFDLYPEMAERYYQDDRAVIESADPKLGIVERYRLASGENRWVRTHKVPYRNPTGDIIGVLVFAEDITERKQADEALKESQELLAESQRLAHVGSWVLDLSHLDDLNRNALRWSDESYRIFGYAPGEVPVTNELFFHHVHPEDRAGIVRAMQDALARGHYEVEHRITRRDGAERICHQWARLLSDGTGRPRRMLGSCQDITEANKRTAELRANQEQLRALTSELTLAEQRERRRLASELHDYLAQLLALSRLKLRQARQGVHDVKAEQRLKEIDETLNDCLLYTQTLVAELAPPLLQESGLPVALKWLAEQMQRHELQVEVHIEPETVRLPDAEAELLFQSVRELLVNVVKHARTSHAVLSLQISSNREILLTVSDAGSGFDPVAVGAAAPHQRTRFGLLSVRERMEALGGRFEVTSVPGHGTRATLILPYPGGPTTAEIPPTPTESAPLCARPGAAPVRVLLVDDHTLLRQALRTLLETETHVQVIGEASDGQEAIDLTDALKPDIILMDINMPKMDGVEATRRIKHQHPTTTVIALTFHNSGTMEREMRAAGATAFVAKSAAAEQVREVIQAVKVGTRPMKETY